ncbi:MAG TPA: cytochrome c [Burkholderiales bacterium]|nr:cytochrome c [Burkholderiales bacterium]
MRTVLLVIVLALLAGATGSPALAQGDAKRGEYLVTAGGCLGCHTEAKEGATPYAGGRELKTPFGTFYGPNITPHPQAGIGRWSEADFIRAMRHGRRPDGANYFPAFPYPSFTGITDNDLRDLWAYLRTLAPSSQASREHDLWFFFGWRFVVTFWKWLYFTPGPFVNTPGVSDVINRGAYLVQALGHCGECHTPRNFLGGPRKSRVLAGGKGPEGNDIPNLTPTGLKKWSDKELQDFLVIGTTPDGDFPDESMAEVITNTTSKLTPQDLAAMIAYLRALPPLPD